ncbi:MAG TPA: alpha/beta hydrolase [Puia sp.]|nr:alpha/beta hydrolase [Puia sp.]
MQEGYVPFGSSVIHYSWGGAGNRLLLCLHGYGESAESFAFLEERLGMDFTILALNLPFHGGTEWKEGLYFDPEKLPLLIGEIVDGLPVTGDRWWLLGYSMGGRVALSLLEKIPEKIEKLALIAPDGLKVNGWYWLATQSQPGNRLFRWAMKRPGFFFPLIRMADKLRWVNPGIYKFIFRYISDAKVRDDLYKRWTVLRGFRPDIRAIRSIIREHHVQVRLLYGRHDRIIRAEKGEQFRKGIEPWCRLDILDTGRHLLQVKYIDELIAWLEA